MYQISLYAGLFGTLEYSFIWHPRVCVHFIKIFFTFQIGMIVTLLLITILSKLDSDAWQDTFLTLTIFGIVLINAFSAVFQGKIFIAGTTVYVSASLACLRVGEAS